MCYIALLLLAAWPKRAKAKGRVDARNCNARSSTLLQRVVSHWRLAMQRQRQQPVLDVTLGSHVLPLLINGFPPMKDLRPPL